MKIECDAYKEFAYDKVNERVGFGPTTERKVSNCAIESQPLIVGGTDAKVGEFPHMVSKLNLKNFLKTNGNSFQGVDWMRS